ncbi:hypothetical protein M3Y99_00355200 [Aphelenchoides fujianensis]|nr:hypothetical protein M3Y99_00355200 [Aphelenchoides fujianensis]
MEESAGYEDQESLQCNLTADHVLRTDATIHADGEEKENVDLRSTTAVGTCKILCLSYEKKRLAAACYEEHGSIVHYMRDTPDDSDFNTMRYLIERVRPTHVIGNSSNAKVFRAALQSIVRCKADPNLTMVERKSERENRAAEEGDGGSTQRKAASRKRPNPSSDDQEAATQPAEVPVFTPNTSTESTATAKSPLGRAEEQAEERVEDESEESDWFAPLQMLPRSCFSVDEGKKWLQEILNFDARDPEVRLKLLFDCEDANMMSAIGALLRHVNQLRIGILTEDVNARTPVESFKAIIPPCVFRGDVLEVDRTTVRALEIFECETPVQNNRRMAGGRRGKQRGSLFDFCNLCKSTPGKHKLRSWFARPLRSREILKNRLDGVSFFQQDCHVGFTHYIRTKLRHINALGGPLARMRLSKIPVQDWINVLKTLQTLIDIGDAIRQYEIALPILGPGARSLGRELARLFAIITATFSKEESLAEKRFVVKPGVSADLDELKELHNELSDYMTQIARKEIKQYGFASCSVCYLPIIGYMVVVPIEEEVQRDIERVYTTADSIGYKTPAMHQLDHRFGDIRSRIIDRETLITNSLQELVLSRRQVIFDAIDVAATLDCLISLALVARENDWNRPRFTEEPLINVDKARHPIGERACAGQFVENPIKSVDPALGAAFSKVKLITGPNASGKSVYLKTVGVVLYLAHVGSFVPVARAEIGPINRIISRMYTIDLVLNGMSSFANDLKQMSDAIRKADGNSVIIIDEFGKGTMTEVGLSLLASCLNFWLEHNSRCPHVFVSTHFHSLRNLLQPSALVSNNLMKVVMEADGDLRFTYEFVKGVCQVLKEGKSLLDITPQSMDEERRMSEVAAKMEGLYGEFAAWKMDEDPLGFLEKFKAALCAASD